MVVFVLLLSLGGWEGAATAQSPIAGQPPIKSVRVFERLCLPSVDPSAGTLQEARAACPDVADGMVFTLTSRDPSYPPIPLTVNSLGEAEWREVPSSVPYTIAHGGSFDYGAAWVTCRFASSLDPAVPDTERTFRPPPPAHTIEIGASEPVLSTYLVVECYWFDFLVTAELPEESDPTATATPSGEEADTTNAGAQTEPETQETTSDTSEATPVDTADTSTSNEVAPTGSGARVDIRGWECPFHVDIRTATAAELQSICQQPFRNVPYTLNGDPNLQQAAGDIGFVAFQDVPFGPLTIRQEAWGSFDAARVFCYTLPATASHGPLQDSQEIAFTSDPDDTFSVTLQVNPGEAVDCIWFDAHVTEDDLGTVLVTAYQCPDGYDPNSGGLSDLLMTCHIPQAGAYFELTQPTAITGNTADANGFIGFVNFTPRTYALAETAPIGWATARVFCRSYQADDWDHPVDPYIEYPVANASEISVTLTAHWETDCAWFDTKGVDYAYLDINAWSCPLNFTPNATTSRDTFAQTCTAGVSGAQFEVDRGFGFEIAGTSTDGYAFFQEPVPYGLLDIRGTGPNTYRFRRVFCGEAPFIGIGAIPSSWTSAAQPRITFPAQVNYQVVCEFYFTPLSTAVDPAANPEADSADDAAVETAASPAPEPVATSNEESDESNAGPTPAIESSQDENSDSGETGTQPASDAPATLVLNLHTCPPGYDALAPGADPAVDCETATGAPSVTLDGAASETSADGVAGWTGLPPGSALIQAAPGAFLGACESDQRALSAESLVSPFVYTSPAGIVGISLLAGETLTCDWFDMATEASGSVIATLLRCPGPTVIADQCAPASGPATLSFEPVGGAGSAFELAIGESGTGQVSATGSYQLTGFPIDACLIESDAFDDTGALVVEPGGTVEVQIYLCGG